MMKKLITAILSVTLFAAALTASPFTAKVQAASSKNTAADQAYDRVRSSLLRKSSGVTYKYVDITGDGVHEFLAEYNPKIGGPARQVIYTYKKGKAKKVLSSKVYGLSSVIAYKKTKTLVLRGLGHGNEQYVYYKMKNGKYKKLASRARVAKAGGAITNGQWYYYNKSSQAVDKTTFSSLINKAAKGKKKKYSVTKWTTIY